MTQEEKLKRIVCDPLLWIKYFCVIVDKEGRKVPFEPTYHQKLLSKNLESLISWRSQGSLALRVLRLLTVCI